MFTVSVTRLRLRSAWYFPAFVWHTIASNRQAKRADGCLGVNLRRAGGAYWTLTLWRDVAAMRAFILSGSHRTAMPHLVNWCDEAAMARFDWAGDTLPSWDEAERQMSVNGKTSPVKHPSPAHAAGLTLGTLDEQRLHHGHKQVQS
jgi:hypothetical protein